MFARMLMCFGSSIRPLWRVTRNGSYLHSGSRYLSDSVLYRSRVSDCHRCLAPGLAFAAVRGAPLQEIPEGSRESVSGFYRPHFGPVVQTLRPDPEQVQPDCSFIRCEQRRKGRCTEAEECSDRATPQGQAIRPVHLDKCSGTSGRRRSGEAVGLGSCGDTSADCERTARGGCVRLGQWKAVK